ncbi:MAG: DUF4446 family protein [Actinobacteria bacterium]|nr:DUF4446 family protein [Actinomycetota bacterium]
MRTELAGWIALGAGGVALIAAVGVFVLWRDVRRTRSALRLSLPDGLSTDLVAHQETLHAGMTRLEAAIRDLEALVLQQAVTTERELRTALRFQGLVRFDAYRDMGGQQSWSVALIDDTKSGTIVTCLHARDHARVYMKELVNGVPSQRLSPEEEHAVATAGRPNMNTQAA